MGHIELGRKLSKVDEQNMLSMCFSEIAKGMLKQATDNYTDCEKQI